MQREGGLSIIEALKKDNYAVALIPAVQNVNVKTPCKSNGLNICNNLKVWY